jgi:hypothetical protein
MTIDREFLCVLLRAYDGIKSKRDSRPDYTFFFNYTDYRNFWFSRDQSCVLIYMISRGFDNIIADTIDERHICWLVDGPTFYATFEMTLVGILFKYYLKCYHSIEEAAAGMIGHSDEILLNRRYSTPLKFCQLMAVADHLKHTFNKEFYRYLRNDCRDFAIEYGKLNVANFDTKTPVEAYFPEKFSIILNRYTTIHSNDESPIVCRQPSAAALGYYRGGCNNASQVALYNPACNSSQVTLCNNSVSSCLRKKKKCRAPLYNLNWNTGQAGLYNGVCNNNRAVLCYRTK